MTLRGGCPGHWAVHCAPAAQVTVQSSVQVIVHVAPSWQLTLPSSTRVMSQLEPWQVTMLPLPATSTQELPVAQVAWQPPPQLPMQVRPAGQESEQLLVQLWPSQGQVCAVQATSGAPASSVVIGVMPASRAVPK